MCFCGVRGTEKAGHLDAFGDFDGWDMRPVGKHDLQTLERAVRFEDLPSDFDSLRQFAYLHHVILEVGMLHLHNQSRQQNDRTFRSSNFQTCSRMYGAFLSSVLAFKSRTRFPWQVISWRILSKSIREESIVDCLDFLV